MRLRPDFREGVRQHITEGCGSCNTLPRTVGDLCISCDRRSRIGPRIRELKVDGSAFKNSSSRIFFELSLSHLYFWPVRAQFLSEWESDSTPNIDKAYEVIVPRDVRAKHEAYR